MPSSGTHCQVVLLVVQDDVWQPDDLRGHVDLLHAAVLAGVPPQLVVVPLLEHDKHGVDVLYRSGVWVQEVDTGRM